MRIFIDLDMTLCDTINPVLSMIEEDFGVKYSISDFHSYGFLEEQLGPKIREYWSREDLYPNVPLYPDAQWFVQLLQRLADTNIITYSMNDITKNHKNEYIQKNFNIDKCYIWHAKEKHLYMNKNDILIDDYLLNIHGHCYHNNGRGILFNHCEENPWVKYHSKTPRTKNHLYANNYARVIQIIKGLL